MDQKDLAARSGFSIPYISLLERGHRDPPLSTIETIASALNMSVIVLMFFAAEEADMEGTPEEVVNKFWRIALTDPMEKD